MSGMTIFDGAAGLGFEGAYGYPVGDTMSPPPGGRPPTGPAPGSNMGLPVYVAPPNEPPPEPELGGFKVSTLAIGAVLLGAGFLAYKHFFAKEEEEAAADHDDGELYARNSRRGLMRPFVRNGPEDEDDDFDDDDDDDDWDDDDDDDDDGDNFPDSEERVEDVDDWDGSEDDEDEDAGAPANDYDWDYLDGDREVPSGPRLRRNPGKRRPPERRERPRSLPMTPNLASGFNKKTQRLVAEIEALRAQGAGAK